MTRTEVDSCPVNFGYCWSLLWVFLRFALVLNFLSSGSVVGIVYGISELSVLCFTLSALVRGRVDGSWRGLLVPVCYSLTLLFVPVMCSPAWAFVIAVGGFLQVALRACMGTCVTVGVPVFVCLLDRGPYGFIRHPLACCELCVVFMLMAAWWSPVNLIAGGIACSGVIAALLLEEGHLRCFPVYGEYMRRVRWRLCPGVW